MEDQESAAGPHADDRRGSGPGPAPVGSDVWAGVTWSGTAILAGIRPLVPLPALALLRETRRLRKVARAVGVLFIDIQGCTRLCEDLPPAEMTVVIERYFSRYLDAVRAAGGEVTEVLGDGLLALFEAPAVDVAARAALQAGRAVQRDTCALNGRRGDHDPITVNMGLNAGVALVGFTRLRARSGERWVYGARGPVMNIAARLCALATDGQILGPPTVAECLPPECPWRSLGARLLKNVTGPVEVVEILPDGAPAARRRTDG